MDNLGNINLQLGNSQAALDAYQESLKIRRQLALNDPDSSHSARFNVIKLGRHQPPTRQAALDAYQRLQIRRQLALNSSQAHAW